MRLQIEYFKYYCKNYFKIINLLFYNLNDK